MVTSNNVCAVTTSYARISSKIPKFCAKFLTSDVVQSLERNIVVSPIVSVDEVKFILNNGSSSVSPFVSMTTMDRLRHLMSSRKLVSRSFMAP